MEMIFNPIVLSLIIVLTVGMLGLTHAIGRGWDD